MKQFDIHTHLFWLPWWWFQMLILATRVNVVPFVFHCLFLDSPSHQNFKCTQVQGVNLLNQLMLCLKAKCHTMKITTITMITITVEQRKQQRM